MKKTISLFILLFYTYSSIYCQDKKDTTKLKEIIVDYTGKGGNIDSVQTDKPITIIITNLDTSTMKNAISISDPSNNSLTITKDSIKKCKVEYYHGDSLKLEIDKNGNFIAPFQPKNPLSFPLIFGIGDNNKFLTINSIQPSPGGDNDNNNANILTPIDLQGHFKKLNLQKTDIGYRDANDYYTIHIFFDQFGNSLFGSLPTGVQRKYHYVAHVLYINSDSKILGYGFNVTAGTLSDNPSFYGQNNTQLLSGIGGQTEDTSKKTLTPQIIDISYNMFPTSDDLTFELDVIKQNDDSSKPPVVSKVQSYTIKKTPFYIGSFSVGVFNTWLANPTYQLTNLPGSTATPPDQTVKITDDGPSINATFMYTVYLSVYNLLYPYSKRCDKGYKYNWWGRTYLDDKGNILRKIYPSFGVGLDGTVLNNWYAGFNIEPMQGFGIFVGQNIRKVNTFDMPNFIPGKTVVTQDDFNYYQNTKWKNDWALGVIIDISIFSKIASSISSSSSGK